MKLRELLLNTVEYGTDAVSWLGRKIGLGDEQDLSQTYAERQFGMWAAGLERNNMRWVNRLHKKLAKTDPSILKSEPGIQQLIDRCLERGLCSQNLYDALRQYGNRDNGLPAIINFRQPS